MEIKHWNSNKVLHFSHLDHTDLETCACPVMKGKWELTLVLYVSLNARQKRVYSISAYRYFIVQNILRHLETIESSLHKESIEKIALPY